MENLPPELLENVFQNLRSSDRLNCALVCRRWAEVVSTAHLLGDVRLVLRDADFSRALPVLLDSSRRYINLGLINETLFGFDPKFWTRFGEDLRDLQLNDCDLSASVFYSILQECRQLESLELSGCPSLMMSDGLLRLPEHVSIDKIRESLGNVRCLSLRTNRFLTDASFHQILTLMPNCTCLCLAGCSNLQFHPGIFRRFHSGTIEFSSAVLTFQNVLACMMRTKQKFVELDFSGTLINAKAIIQLVELYADSLLKLRLNVCDQLTTKAYEAIGECSKLRLLSLEGSCQTQDCNLESILPKTADLEHLDLGYCSQITDRGAAHVVQLKRLRHLSLQACRSISNDAFGSLGALTQLQHLDLSYTRCDATVFRRLTALRDLRVLNLVNCRDLDSECYTIICNSFRRLETLNLEYCVTLTDDAGVRLHTMTELRDVTLTGAVGVTDRTLENGVGSSDMKALKLGFCSLTDSAMVSIATHHVCLEHLDLSGCGRITDVGLISVVQCLPRLRTLQLKSCRSLTDRSLDALRHHCPHLRRLVVEHCSMSVDAVDLLAHIRPTIDIN